VPQRSLIRPAGCAARSQREGQKEFELLLVSLIITLDTVLVCAPIATEGKNRTAGGSACACPNPIRRHSRGTAALCAPPRRSCPPPVPLPWLELIRPEPHRNAPYRM
jgi:hypothetical protein